MENPAAPEIWVAPKENDLEPFATLYIRNKVVVGVEHEVLDREAENIEDLFNALFKTSAKLTAEHKASCQLETGSNYVADGTSMSKAFLTMYCGPYRIVFMKNTFKNAGGNTVSGYVAQEELGQTE